MQTHPYRQNAQPKDYVAEEKNLVTVEVPIASYNCTFLLKDHTDITIQFKDILCSADTTDKHYIANYLEKHDSLEEAVKEFVINKKIVYARKLLEQKLIKAKEIGFIEIDDDLFFNVDQISKIKFVMTKKEQQTVTYKNFSAEKII